VASTRQHKRQRGRLVPVGSPAVTDFQSDPAAQAAAAARQCQQRVRTLLGDYVPIPAYADALTSVIMSYAQEYAHAMARISTQATTRQDAAATGEAP
jgi:hypothetical protein